MSTQNEKIIILCQPCFNKKQEYDKVMTPTFLAICDICEGCGLRIPTGDPVIRLYEKGGI